MVHLKKTYELNRKIRVILLFIGFLIISKCWIGIYADDEFGELHFFIKPRPIWKTYFYSPRGMNDWKISEMPFEKQEEQKLFDEFVLKLNSKEIE